MALSSGGSRKGSFCTQAPHQLYKNKIYTTTTDLMEISCCSMSNVIHACPKTAVYVIAKVDK